ncbi:MAG: hypothetical protein Q7U73_11790 [Rubrivivax sp.]|nr:hypothetical protein [Rubrivivax sp.]
MTETPRVPLAELADLPAAGEPLPFKVMDSHGRLLLAAGDRALRAPLAPQLAAPQLFQEEQGRPIAAALIHAVGVYPPGDWEQLKGGEIGVVVQRAEPGRGAVVVAPIGANGKAVPGVPRRDTAQPAFAITAALGERAEMPRVLPEQVFGPLEA